MFEPLPAKFDFPASEKKVLEFWEANRVFERTLEQRAGAPRFVFYEGPPTANGMPHPGHALTRAMKDIFPRYRTMTGHLVERKAGWDTHGLPVEREVCKELGIRTKREIEQYGVEKFVHRCIESVFRYTREWEEMTRRIGFWVNLQEAYVTYHQSYVESVWWSLKTLFERGLLYQGHKVVWWWAQGGTALSSGEVGEGYRAVDDPSVFVRFPLIEEGTETRSDGTSKAEAGEDALDELEDAVAPDSGIDKSGHHGRTGAEERLEPPPAEGRPRPASLLVWTTTPWTLISNHFAAVHPDLDYALVLDRTTNERLYIAAGLVEAIAKKVKHELQVLVTVKGRTLLGKRYKPPFPEVYYEHVPGESTTIFGMGMVLEALEFKSPGVPLGQMTAEVRTGGREPIGWRVLGADFVTLDAGTGLVHEAPAFGEVDFVLLNAERQRFVKTNAIPLLCAVAPDGTFTPDAPQQWRGRWVKECDKEIIRELKERGLLYHQETYRHDYPFCPQAPDDPLIQYARTNWFVRTSQFKEEFLKNNAVMNWLPEHIKEGRMGDFLRNNVDWALSRERYWGTPLPIWVCEKTGRMEAIGSFTELKDKPGATDGGFWEKKVAEHRAAGDAPMPEHLRVHKPYIDAWTYDSIYAEGARMRRVPEVIDCWWDAGSMPFAQWGFPHVEGSVQQLIERFPADFISEAIDQTRGWFYALLAINTLLFRPASIGRGSAGVSPAHGGDHAGSGSLTSPITESLTIRKRSKLPHWESGGSTYFLTFRSALGDLAPDERAIVLSAIKHWDGQRLRLHAAVVMPDHVHILATPLEKKPGEWWSIADLMHSIKSFAAKEINSRRGRSGTVWQADYYDRIIRSESDFEEKWGYVTTNPQRKGLPIDYEWVWVECESAPAPDRSAHDVTRGRDARAPRDDARAPRPDARAPREDARAPRDADERNTLSADYPLPFRTCIVLGLIMGEDGNKMSKKLRNYKEPAYIFDTYGADAMRWYFFSAQAPWTSVRFQEAAIRDSQREFLVRLYNVFSFFNIYANIDGFQAVPTKEYGHRPTAERSEIDRWIISELMRTIRFVRESMDRFENFPAAGRINDFVDALSNWYVRRSRDRFWQSGKNQDKWDAYHTLYGCLYTLSILIAPFTPFFAETMYQNLVGSGARCRAGQDAQENDETKISVHLCDYPAVLESLIDESLSAEMDVVREIASLGRAARAASVVKEAKKVRQPLPRVEIVLARPEYREWLADHAALIAEEVNVKAVEFTTEADRYVSYKVVPNFPAIGKKYRALVPGIKAALAALSDPGAARKTLTSTGTLPLTVDGQTVELTPDEVEIRLEARPGWSAAQGRAGVVVISTELTPELLEEGLVREFLHEVQAMRKDAQLAYEARITLHVQADPTLTDVLRRFDALIRQECLADQLVFDAPPTAGVELRPVAIEGRDAKIGIARR